MTREEYAAKKLAWRQYFSLYYCCMKWAIYNKFDMHWDIAYVDKLLHDIPKPPKPTIADYEKTV